MNFCHGWSFEDGGVCSQVKAKLGEELSFVLRLPLLIALPAKEEEEEALLTYFWSWEEGGGGEKGPGGKYDSIAQDSSVGGNWELGGAADLVKLSIFEQKAASRSSSPSKEIAADLFTSRSHCQLFLSLSRTFPSWGFLNPIRSNLHSDIGIRYVVAFVIHRCLSSIQIITERCQCFIMRSCVINAGRLFVIQYISWCSNIAVTQRAVLYAVGLALRRPGPHCGCIIEHKHLCPRENSCLHLQAPNG